MKYLLIILLQFTLFASSYNFDEYKFVSAASTEFKKSGTIAFDGNRTIITYTKPKYKQIITDGVNVSIEGSSGKVFNLKGKAKYFTNQFISVMTMIDEFSELKICENFDMIKKSDIYELSFKGSISEQILNAEVITKNKKVISFKIFMNNNDTLEIIKK